MNCEGLFFSGRYSPVRCPALGGDLGAVRLWQSGAEVAIRRCRENKVALDRGAGTHII